MSDIWFRKKPCKHCPFRRDVTPFLHPERAADIAYIAQNPYSSFACHETTEDSDNDDGERIVTRSSLECAGLLSLRFNESDEKPEGFEPSDEVYDTVYDMIDAYEEEWDK